MNRSDWDKGLPYDVMAIVINLAPGSTTTTRAVSRTWKTGAEGQVHKIKIPFGAPVPSSFHTMGDRFPELTSLDVGESTMDVEQLHQLAGIAKLKHLRLGARKDPGKDFPCTIESKPPELPRKCLALNVRNLEVENVRRINTIKVLDLRGCTSFDDDGMSRLRGMQLEQLVLVRSKLLTDKAMAYVGEMTTLTHLTLEQITKLTNRGLIHLLKLQLVWLSLKGCIGLMDDSVSTLRKLDTLQHLSLEGCHGLSKDAIRPLGHPMGDSQQMSALTSLDVGLVNTLTTDSLKGMMSEPKSMPPLKRLILEGCKKMTNEAATVLAKLPHLEDLSIARWVYLDNTGLAHLANNEKLTRLNMENCYKITDAAMEYLANKPLTSLDMRRCNKVTAVGIQQLFACPLERLYLRRCVELNDAALEHLRDMRLRELDLRRCSKITDDGLQWLVGMPLRYLDLGHCTRVTDVGMVHLRDMPLEYLVLVSLKETLTPAGLVHVRDCPLVYLDVRHCPGLPPQGAGLAEFEAYAENAGRKIKIIT